MNSLKSKDLVIRLNPGDKRRATKRSVFHIFQRKYALLFAFYVFVGFFCFYSWTSMGMKELCDDKLINEKFDDQLRRKISLTSLKSNAVEFHDVTDYHDADGNNTWSWTSTERMDAEEISWKSDEISRESTEMACHLPMLNPFDASVARFNETPEPANCTKDHPLIFDTDMESNLIQREDPSIYGYHFCCYQKFSRAEGSDLNMTLEGRCVPIEKIITPIPKTADFIRVSCLRRPKHGEHMTMEPVDLFGFVHLKPAVENRIKRFQGLGFTEEPFQAAETDIREEYEKPLSSSDEEKRKVNVVILGLDAASHMNFIRSMPLSHDYLTKNLSAHSLSGHTKVADATFANLVSVLTGLTEEELKEVCWKDDSVPFDDCPFIWNDFAAQGYRTAYGEDEVWMAIFNYAKRGFMEQPTDYYYNALTHQLREQVGHHELTFAKLCYGPRVAFEVSLNFLKKMAHTMEKTRRYFQFIWVSSLFHDGLNEGKLGDEFLLETLHWFMEGGYFEDTVFILMSDHGIRWGDIRTTLQGRLEERMPFLYFIFPEWFKEKYRAAVSNLIRNERRLTTPFDLHETLEDLLYLDNLEDVRKRYDSLDDLLPRGISLFLPIPTRRTCDDAGIDEHWCVCRSIKSVNLENNTLVEEAARSVVIHLNDIVIKFPQCLPLQLNRVLNAQVFQSSYNHVDDFSETIVDATDPRLANQEITFTISLEVSPSEATFEATTTRRTDGSWEVSDEISRTNVYGSQSICVSDYNLKKLCFCG